MPIAAEKPASQITGAVLKQRQAYPLDIKVRMTLTRIGHWYDLYGGNVYVAFSGGKDSTVLLHLVRSVFPEVPAVFVDTGLEYPEIKDFVRDTDNVTWLRPALTFKQVLDHHGWPVISKAVADAVNRIRSPGTSARTKHKAMYGDERGSFGKLPQKWRWLLGAPFAISPRCCEVMKIRPVQKYHKETGRASFVGVMAGDSNKRSRAYLKHGCYQADLAVPKCTPMAFWTDLDVWDYLDRYEVPYCPIYDGGVSHTGCMFCCFGLQHETEPNRFQLMQYSHPEIYRYCMDKLGLRDVLTWLGLPFEIEQRPPLCPRRRREAHLLGQDGMAPGGLGAGRGHLDAHDYAARSDPAAPQPAPDCVQ